VLSFTSMIIVVAGISFVVIYTSFAEYREEEFQQRLKEKTTFTLTFLEEVQVLNRSILHALDRVTLNEMYEEKILLFDKDKKLIYSSIDDLKITFTENLLKELTPQNNWIETKNGDYDVVAVYLRFQDDEFYGISMAYDAFGYAKLEYLGVVLIITFISMVIMAVLLTFYISQQISRPLIKMAAQIESVKFDSGLQDIDIPQTKDEIHQLATRFNELMKRLNESFEFQKHAVHHISHELKTPIAVLVSNLERAESETDLDAIKLFLQYQKEDTKNLADIINALLEIAKAESGFTPHTEILRMDDLLFDSIEKLKPLNPGFSFSVSLSDKIEREEHLTLNGNKRLLKAAIINLLVNAIQYNAGTQVNIELEANMFAVKIAFKNEGEIIQPHEQPFMFQHFFRGENSRSKRGFGLGLVFIHKIIQLHGGTITYHVHPANVNVFTITMPLR
jgi:signal transduction histidine kinase